MARGARQSVLATHLVDQREQQRSGNMCLVEEAAARTVEPALTAALLDTALAYCERKLAFLIMDPPVSAAAD